LVKGRRDLASGAAKAVLLSVENGTISLPQNEIEFLKSLG